LLAGARALGVRTLNASGLPIVEFPTAVDADLARVGAFLQAEGIYTTVAAYPLVARANTGFRVQVTAANTVEEIDLLLAVLAKLADQGWMRLEDGDLRPGLV
jgi:8-amino-7-oxononanoate synthase